MLQIKGLRKKYQGFCLECSMEVKPGCITGLIGQNGAGKSTTFKAALGLLAPDAGEVRLFGKPPEELTGKEKERIGVVLSDASFSEYLSPDDLAPVMDALYSGFDRREFARLCADFEIPMGKKLKDFSTGMRAKVNLLLAISHGADFLILDEPTAGLDVVARDALLEILRGYMEQKPESAILISSHISGDLEGLCDDIYMIHQGKIVLHEDTDVLLGEYGVLKLDERQFAEVERSYILAYKEEPFGYSCLTSQKQFYMENYPEITVEKSGIDSVIMILSGGKNV